MGYFPTYIRYETDQSMGESVCLLSNQYVISRRNYPTRKVRLQKTEIEKMKPNGLSLPTLKVIQ